MHERITLSHLQISASQGYNKKQLHGRIKNPTLKRILVIDDNDDINLVFKVGLEENGFVADSCAVPLGALQNFKADLLDLLIIDIMMPALNTLDLNQEMRSVEDKFKFFFDSRAGLLLRFRKEVSDRSDDN